MTKFLQIEIICPICTSNSNLFYINHGIIIKHELDNAADRHVTSCGEWGKVVSRNQRAWVHPNPLLLVPKISLGLGLHIYGMGLIILNLDLSPSPLKRINGR